MTSIHDERIEYEGLLDQCNTKIGQISDILDTKVGERAVGLEGVRDIVSRKMLGIGDIIGISKLEKVIAPDYVHRPVVTSYSQTEIGSKVSGDLGYSMYPVVIVKEIEGYTILYDKYIGIFDEDFNLLNKITLASSIKPMSYAKAGDNHCVVGDYGVYLFDNNWNQLYRDSEGYLWTYSLLGVNVDKKSNYFSVAYEKDEDTYIRFYNNNGNRIDSISSKSRTDSLSGIYKIIGDGYIYNGYIYYCYDIHIKRENFTSFVDEYCSINISIPNTYSSYGYILYGGFEDTFYVYHATKSSNLYNLVALKIENNTLTKKWSASVDPRSPSNLGSGARLVTDENGVMIVGGIKTIRFTHNGSLMYDVGEESRSCQRIISKENGVYFFSDEAYNAENIYKFDLNKLSGYKIKEI